VNSQKTNLRTLEHCPWTQIELTVFLCAATLQQYFFAEILWNIFKASQQLQYWVTIDVLTITVTARLQSVTYYMDVSFYMETHLRITKVADNTGTQDSYILLDAWTHRTGQLLTECQSNASLLTQHIITNTLHHCRCRNNGIQTATLALPNSLKTTNASMSSL